MIVADTSALISLATADCLDLALTEFDIHTTDVVWAELEDTADYTDPHGTAARKVLDRRDQLTVHPADESPVETSRIDAGEGSCLHLAEQVGAAFLLTDDLRALPELQQATTAQVAISPIVLKALVKRDVLDRDTALDRLDQLAATRDWLGSPIYRRAKQLFNG
jgi:predicted nucleic acid-binding protein